MAGRGTRRAVITGALLTACALAWLASSSLRSPAGRARQAANDVASTGAIDAAGEPTGAATRRPAAGGASASRPAAATRPETSDEVRARLARQALERRARNDARYEELAARWASEASEPRDEPWSTDQERSLRGAATASGLDHLLFELECRRTLCRLELSAADSDTAFALQRARAFDALLGTDVGSAMVSGGPDRALQIFAAREGMGSAKGP